MFNTNTALYYGLRSLVKNYRDFFKNLSNRP
jgi:hypothetical protein